MIISMIVASTAVNFNADRKRGDRPCRKRGNQPEAFSFDDPSCIACMFICFVNSRQMEQDTELVSDQTLETNAECRARRGSS